MSETVIPTRRWVAVAVPEDIPEGEVRTYPVGPGNVAVARKDGQLYAVQDLCTHDDGPLGEGTLDGYAIECPRHGARFDIRSGAVLRMPAIMPIETFPVMEKDGSVVVAIPAAAAGEDAGDDAGDDW